MGNRPPTHDGTDWAAEFIRFRAEVNAYHQVNEHRLAEGSKTMADLKDQSPNRLVGKAWMGIIATVLTVGISWGQLQTSKIDSAKAKELIHEHSPYKDAAGRIDRVVQRYDGDREALTRELGEIKSELRSISTELKGLKPANNRGRRR